MKNKTNLEKLKEKDNKYTGVCYCGHKIEEHHKYKYNVDEGWCFLKGCKCQEFKDTLFVADIEKTCEAILKDDKEKGGIPSKRYFWMVANIKKGLK